MNSIKMVYNNIINESFPDLISAHGFAAWIEFGGKQFLFDTGGDSFVMMNNLKLMNVDFSSLDSIVISHNHWDHVFGLPGILRATNNKPTVYLPKDSLEKISEQYPGGKYLEITEPIQISSGVWITGPMKALYKGFSFYEQSLVLETDDRLILLVGCSHPGITEIMENIKSLFPGKRIENIIGGFHLVNHSENEITAISEQLKKLGAKNISPSHCTGKNALNNFGENWGNNYVQLYLGDIYKF